jgi:hypothetical protein
MFTPAPSEHELAAAGLTLADLEDEAVKVWPENEDAWRLFCYAQTQWRVGPGGASGLDYTPLQHKMDRMRLAPEEYEALESDVRVMEFAALEAMSKKD